ncbi:MAG: response regulator [Lentimicrobium sp.]|jgi:CheY-like chemotaxis protein|nr:response regulator [Lentimicrobium sp.]
MRELLFTDFSGYNKGKVYDWSGKTILIAEDTDCSFLYLKTILRNTSASILWASSGQEAINLVREHREIDVILMDINMPGISGFEATVGIHSIRPGLPVIAQTAYVHDNEVELCFASGCIDYISKPIDKNLLLEKLSVFLGAGKPKEKKELLGN